MWYARAMRKPPAAVYMAAGIGSQATVYSMLARLAARHDRRLGWTDGRPGPLTRLGLVPVAAGIAFIAAAVAGHHRAAPDEGAVTARPTYLATEGAYAVSRNPLYVGGMTTWLGWTIFLGSRRAAVAGSALLAGFAFIGVPWEERALRSTFQEEYDDYARRVPRWL